MVVEAIRAHGHRVLVSRGWADLALIDDRDDCFAVGEANQQALFGRVADAAGTRTDGATVAAKLLLDAVSREAPSVSA